MQQDNPAIIIRRHSYEEPYHLELEFVVTGSNFSGRISEIYCIPEQLLKLSQDLTHFPQQYPDEYLHVFGSESMQHYFKIRLYTPNTSEGALQFKLMTSNNSDPESVSFYLKAISFEALRKLGTAVQAFSRLEHQELQWFIDGHYQLLS